MSESFADLFEESLRGVKMEQGSIVAGTVVDIEGEWVVVHAGLKSEGLIPLSQFLNDKGEVTITIGDTVKVAMEMVDDGWGETRLSREKAKRAETWDKLDHAFTNREAIKGIINGKDDRRPVESRRKDMTKTSVPFIVRAHSAEF